jgi:alcohol dehydrogenase
MKALVYHEPGKCGWEEKPRPSIQEPTDAIVRVTHTTICGTDLHILKGDVPAVQPGRILGHEGVGVIEEVGEDVEAFKPGERVLISCVTSCGRCDFCRKNMYAHCRNGGWILGHLIDGTQAEFVRIPQADSSLYKLPPGLDESVAVMLSDILPTGHEIGVRNGEVKLGDTLAIVGAGPIGLACLLTAQFYSPAEIIMVDMDENRLEVARNLGATQVVREDPVRRVLELTENEGVDVAIEAVGLPETFDICQSIVKPGGHIANVGVHGKPVEFHIETLWIKNITLRTGLVNTDTIPLLLKTLKAGRLDPGQLITHSLKLDEIERAYAMFGNAAREKAIKILLMAAH